MQQTLSTKEVRMNIDSATKIIKEFPENYYLLDSEPPYELNKQGFEKFAFFRNNLLPLYSYSKIPDYYGIDFDKVYLLNKLEGTIKDPGALRDGILIKEKLARALYFSNEGLIEKFLTKRKLPDEEFYWTCQDTLMRCVHGFDVSLKWKFSTFTSKAFRNEISKQITHDNRKSRHGSYQHVSLNAHAPGLNYEYIDFLEAMPINSDEEIMREKVNKVLSRFVESLPEREQIIIKDYFGLNEEENQTLGSIGYKLDLSRERIRQIKGEALKYLSTIPEIAALRDSL